MKQPDENKTCAHCGDPAETVKVGGHEIDLCADCETAYWLGDDKTGYCSVSCIISGQCDESC